MTIYDNISGDNLAMALKNTLKSAKRADFCIGYFNLRGWDLLRESVDALPGGLLDERFDDDATYNARVLIGMQKHPREDLEDYYALRKNEISNEKAVKLKREMAAEFRRQLTIGRPNNKERDYLFENKATGKVIYDEIDNVLAKHYGFTAGELDFIIDYDIKYRMAGELGGEE
ncbi:MAG: hypothetical protein LBF63_06170 [Treponema sp.]|jgi:hypothetical protein|nr:hypothetical protein [Treponema sp.]